MILEGSSPLDAIEMFCGQPPPYVILSHTWGDGEVSLQDMDRKDISYKAGFMKIRNCCQQALEHMLRYAWVDTCCIDKTSSAEISEAINSMFRWYSEAEVCYAFLEDIELEDTPSLVQSLDLSGSRWFTRGWTLQELLAPRKIIFYSASWQRIGTRKGLATHLSHITGIATFFLVTGGIQRLRFAGIAQRMSWAAQRNTTRVEDTAYSLLGIFEISMPLLYGEGMRAFMRLQEELLK
jgi:hypothetical protein